MLVSMDVYRYIKLMIALLAIDIFLVVAVFMYIQYVTVQSVTSVPTAVPDLSLQNNAEQKDLVLESSAATATEKKESAATDEEILISDAVTPVTKSIVIDSGIFIRDIPLSDTQKELLGKAGIDVDTYYLEPAVISCAANALGEDRYQEIVSGASPGLLEMTKLLGCIK